MTPAFGGQYSIQLSYGRCVCWQERIITRLCAIVLRTTAVVLSRPARLAVVLQFDRESFLDECSNATAQRLSFTNDLLPCSLR